jgi:hypothetical protein
LSAWVIGLIAYGTTFAILLVVFYFYERAKAGPVKPRVVLIMAELAALFALFPATAYLLLTELLKRHR